MNVVVTNALGKMKHGEQQLLSKLLELLQERKFSIQAIAADPDAANARFTNVDFIDTPGSAEHVPALVRGVVARWRLAITLLSPWVPGIYRLLPDGQRDAVQALRKAELIVACPGGYLANPGDSAGPELAQLWVAAMARAPLVLAPMSISEPQSGLQRWLLRRILRRARQVFVREAQSELVCRDLEVTAILSNDIGFLDEGFSNPPKINEAPTHIAVSLITRKAPGHGSDEAQRRYLDGMVNAIGAIARKTNLPVQLIVQNSNDMTTARQLANSLTVPTRIVDDIDSPEKLNALLRLSYCLIASRFGSVMEALAASCPVAVLISHPEHRNMLNLYGLDDLGLPVESFDADALSTLLMRWGDDRTGFRQRCASLRDSLRRVGDPFVDCLASVTIPEED